MRKASWILLVVLVSVVGRAGDDKDAAYYQKQFTHWSTVIANLKEADVTDACGADIEVIRTLIGQGQAFVASDKLDQAEPVLKRIKAQAAFVRAKVDRISAVDSADEAEEVAKVADGEAQKLTADLTAAEARVKELEAQGL